MNQTKPLAAKLSLMTVILAGKEKVSVDAVLAAKYLFVVPDSVVYSDCWRRYNTLDVSEFKHYRINHSSLFADKGKSHQWY